MGWSRFFAIGLLLDSTEEIDYALRAHLGAQLGAVQLDFELREGHSLFFDRAFSVENEVGDVELGLHH